MREGDTRRDSQSSARLEDYATVKVVGSLGNTTKGRRIEIQAKPVPMKLGSVLEALEKDYGLELPRESTLVIVNGVEARALEDLDTVIRSGDEVVLVPMFHGGSEG